MQRVTPVEPFNPDPDARYLRESPGPLAEEQRLPGRWLLALLLVTVVLSCSACSAADAAEPSASAEDLKRAAMSAWACPGEHAEWSGAVVVCLKESP
ncbi:hypothetical protein [Delftia tsuruhatensis]|uniref:hypothetical protein n=1 Tax=Delftia tsuruhatensis TaxID=180282 RepID=UPI002AD3B5E6|nr:hypothetical protein [Delftia tsuruhatensis]WQM81729.1 hypothetical protein RNT40_23920 [Delftia tsuruhatensis]